MPFRVEKWYSITYGHRRDHFVQREYFKFAGNLLTFVNDDLTMGAYICTLTPSELNIDARRFRYFREEPFLSNQMTIDMSREEVIGRLIPWVNKQKVRWSFRPVDLHERHRTRNGFEFGRKVSQSRNLVGPARFKEKQPWLLSFEKSTTAVFFYMNHAEILHREDNR